MEPKARFPACPPPPQAANHPAPNPQPKKSTAKADSTPAPGAAHPDPSAIANWQSRLLARLERYKRYPEEAQSRGEHGVRILRSPGSALLDRAAVALPRCAASLPPPPAGLGGQRIPIIVPIRYSIR